MSSRAERGDLGCSERAGRKERLLRSLALVCHRERSVAISIVRSQQGKREIASRARLSMSSRGTWRSRLFRAGRQKREIASQARLSMSSRGTWRSRLFRAGKQKREIASQARLSMSSRGAWRSRLLGVGRQKREIASQARNDNAKGRGDLGYSGLSKQKERLLRRLALACHRERSVAISLVLGWQAEKRDCFAGSQ